MKERHDTQTVSKPKDTAATEQQVGYPDISKANTKTIVIISLICILLIFLLSIFIPEPSDNGETSSQSGTTGSTTEITTEVPDTEEASQGLFDMGSIPASVTTEVFNMQIVSKPRTGFATIEENTYYFNSDQTRFTGWLMIDDTSYYFGEDGTMITGWYTIDGHEYYFNNKGILQTSQWIEDKYVDENGHVLTNTLTPDGIYVGKDGKRNNSISLTTSRQGLTDLKAELVSMTENYSGSWSVYVKDIDNNEYLTINNVQCYSASLIKLYCAATAYDLMDKGELEQTESIDRLMAEMISVSDNDAFNLMVMNCAKDNSHITGRNVIQNYIDKNGYENTVITSILVPTRYKASSSPGRNSTSVADCGLLLEKIYKRKCVSPEASEEFLELLLNQTSVNKIPAGLPEGTKCANKTGETDECQHDAAIVYSPGRDYILCIMSSDCGASINNIQDISGTVYDYFN